MSREDEIGGPPRPRRRTDRKWRRVMWDIDWAWRRIVPLIAIGLAAFAIINVQQGRRVSLSITCAATNATITAGRNVIAGGNRSTSPAFERNLRRLGYPPASVRRARAQQSANEYAQAIARAVQRQAGPDAQGVVRPDGTLNCARVREVSRAP